MGFIFKNIKKVETISIVIWLAAQFILIYHYFGSPQYSDAEGYQILALDCYNNQLWYPMKEQTYLNYIFNPGYVNFLILQLKIFGTFLYNGIIGLILNVLLLFSLRTIVGSILIPEAKVYFTILFCLLSSNWFSIIPTMSELFFATLLFFSLSLIQKKYILLISSACVMCYANYTRPLFILFVLPILLYMIYSHFGWKKIATYFISYLFFSILLTNIVINNTSAIGKSGGTTMGYNLAMGANDYINGTCNDVVFSKGNYGYITKKMTVYEKDNYWRNGAINWILNNPIKYLSWMPNKFARLWWGDYYQYGFLENDKALDKTSTTIDVLYRIFKIVLFSLFYYFILFLFIKGIWITKKKIIGYWGIFLIPVFLASLMHIILYGGLRYHYPYMPILIFYSTLGILNHHHNYPVNVEN